MRYYAKEMRMIVCGLVMFLVCGQALGAFPSDPDNAALVYFQAFMHHGEPEGEVRENFRDYSAGVKKPSEALEDYISGCRTPIRLAVRASKIEDCDWGLYYSDGFDMVMAHLAPMRRLVFTMMCKARIEIEQGNYDEAVELCLAVRRMGQHFDDPVLISYLVARAVDRYAYGRVRDLLPLLAEQPGKLQRLKRELVKLSSKGMASSMPALRMEKEMTGGYMTVERIKELLDALDAGLVSGEEDDSPDWPKITETMVEKSRDYYDKHMESAFSLMEQGKPYVQTYPQLVKLDGEPKADAKKDDAAKIAAAIAPGFKDLYSIETAAKAAANATMAGLEVYLVKARSGELPDELPKGVARDPFTDKDFEYKKTRSGFILRCGAKDMKKNKVHEFEFGGSE